MMMRLRSTTRLRLYRSIRSVASLGAVAFVGAAALDLTGAAFAQQCSLGGTCNINVTTTAGLPGLGTVTQVTPLEVDLTELNANGTGKVTGVVPEGAVTFDVDKKTKTVSTKRKKGKRKTSFNDKKTKTVSTKRKKGKRKTSFNPDKKAKAGVTVKASQQR